MEKELIIRSGPSSVDFALIKDGKLIELHKENEDGNKFAVSDIFVARVRKTIGSLNAAFVNVGYEKDGFLHYHDLGPQLNSLVKFYNGVSAGRIKNFSLADFKLQKDIDKHGKITDVLKGNQPLLVQVVKEPISTKGPRLSSELSLPGRYVVLVPFSNRISISQKIEDKEEKSRLKRLVLSIRPKNFGVIVRTVAKDKKVAELDADIQNLMKRWDKMCSVLRGASFPSKVMSELSRANSILRDVFNDTFTSITVDDEELYLDIKEYLSKIAPHKENIVKLYTNTQLPVFEKYGVERQIKTAFGKSVSMTKGAYLIIEHTEAMHVIDVNSGNRSNKGESQEESALQTNLIAASEIARQLRLRDMGGIIVVDFIDMSRSENRRKLYDHLRKEMEDDRAKHKILPPSKFGLIQITRQRVREEVNIKTREADPNGSNGEVEAPIVVIDKITQDINRLIKEGKKNFTLNAHPFIAAYLRQGYPSHRTKWFMKHKRWIKVIPRDAYTYLEYQILDKDGNRIN